MASPEPLFAPHLRSAVAHGKARGTALRRRGVRALRPSTALAVAAAAFVGAGWLLGLGPWLAALVLYAVVVVYRGVAAGAQFRSLSVGGLVCVGLVLTHMAYVSALVTGVVRGR